MNNGINNNQHYITESFVKSRFGSNGFVQRYDIKWDSWKTASPQFVFSGRGYTQLLMAGEPVDNSLETSFAKLENELRIILPALDDCAKRDATPVSNDIFENLCLYCGYLWHLSPFAKAKAPAEFVWQLDMDLQHGNVKHLRDLKMSEQDIAAVQKLHAMGAKFIINGQDYLQWAFRVQFVRNAIGKAVIFRNNTQWTVYNSPIELPISDIALIDYPEPKNRATLFILPISPHLVLIGRLEHGTSPQTTAGTTICGKTLTPESAEDVLDIISLSAIKTVACKNKIDIKASRERAKKKKIAFTKIADVEFVLSAGAKSFNPNLFRLLPVPKDKFTQYVHSFIRPPTSTQA